MAVEQQKVSGLTGVALRWALKRVCGEGQAGRLVWVARDGTVEDLGVYSLAQLRELHWGVSAGYGLALRRDIRSRLAAIRTTSGRLSAACHVAQVKQRTRDKSGQGKAQG